MKCIVFFGTSSYFEVIGVASQLVVLCSHQAVSDSQRPQQASLSPTVSQGLPKLMSIESVVPSKHLMLCHPLLLLPSIFF